MIEASSKQKQEELEKHSQQSLTLTLDLMQVPLQVPFGEVVHKSLISHGPLTLSLSLSF